MRIAPNLKQTRWQMRVDLPIRLGRLITRSYRVLTIETANIELTNGEGIDVEIDVDAEGD